jgi:hypothetical protein
MDSFSELAERLKLTNLQLRRQLEVAEALLPPIHQQVLQLDQLGLTGDIVILGNVLYQHEYPPASGRSETAQLYQAALLIPGGIGVANWDTEMYLSQRQSPEGLEADAIVRFEPLETCTIGIKALLLQEVHYLLEQLVCRVLPELRK